MTSALLLFWPLLIGFFLTRALAARCGFLLGICFGAGLGVGVVSCCFFLDRETGVPSLLFEALVLAASMAACRRKRQASPPHDTIPVAWWLMAAFVVVVAGALYSFQQQVSQYRLGSWDAWAIWNLHARFLATPAWRDLFSEAIGWTHPDYPLLIPGFIARVWTLQAHREFATPAALAFLFTFGTIGLLGTSVSQLRGRAQGILAALFLAATPYFIAQGASEIADVPLSFFILATVSSLACRQAALAGVCAGMAAWTKNEGLLLIAVLLAVRGWRKQGAWFIAGLAPVLAIVLFFRFTLATSNYYFGGRPAGEMLSLLTDPDRWRVTGAGLFRYAGWFGGLAAYLGLAGVDTKTHRFTLLTGFATLCLVLAGYCAVCVLTPGDIHWQIDTALERLLLQLWPATLFLAFLAARNPWYDAPQGNA